MTPDDQKSIIIDVKMKNSEKWYALETDKKLRACTQDCRTSALYQGIGRGDEVIFTLNSRDQFSYLKATGQKFDLAQLPQPATKEAEKKPIIIDAGAEQQKKEPEHGRARDPQNPEVPAAPVQKTDWQMKFDAEQRKQEIIHWQALLNTATDIVIWGGDEKEERSIDGIGIDETTEQAVKRVAANLHAFIMEKVDGTKQPAQTSP